jgi:hypothetical protein
MRTENLRVGGVNAALRNPTAAMLPAVGGPCGGQRVRNLPGNPRHAMLCRPGRPGRFYPYRWDGEAYVYCGGSDSGN